MFGESYYRQVRPWLSKAGDAMVGNFLTLFQDPVEDLHAVTKRYVDNLLQETAVSTLNSRHIWLQQQNGMTSGLSASGVANGGVTTSGVALAVDSTAGPVVQYTNAANAGWTSSSAEFQLRHLPDMTFVIETGSDISLTRYYIGLGDGGSNAVSEPINFVGFNFNNVYDANGAPYERLNSTQAADTTWHTLTSDATTGGDTAAIGHFTLSDTGITMVSSTRYALRIKVVSVGKIEFYINGSLVGSHATTGFNFPVSSLTLYVHCHIVPNGVSRQIRIRLGKIISL